MRRWLLITVIALAAIGALVWPTGPIRAPSAQPPLASAKVPIEDDEIEEDAEDELSHATYRQVAGASACSTDCAARQGGFAWARDNDIENAEDCRGLEPLRASGCRAYAAALQKTEAELRKRAADAGKF